MSGILYLVGTPIGNFGDMTDRARETLGPKTRPLRLGVNLSGRLVERYWGRDNCIGLIRHVLNGDSRFGCRRLSPRWIALRSSITAS